MLPHLSVTSFACKFCYCGCGNFHRSCTCDISDPYCPCVAHSLYHLGQHKDGKRGPQGAPSLNEGPSAHAQDTSWFVYECI